VKKKQLGIHGGGDPFGAEWKGCVSFNPKGKEKGENTRHTTKEY